MTRGWRVAINGFRSAGAGRSSPGIWLFFRRAVLKSLNHRFLRTVVDGRRGEAAADGRSGVKVDMKERREIVRQKCLLQARIYLNHRRSIIDCVLRDATKAGGRLKLRESTALPKFFEIYVPSKDRYLQARAVWHRGHYVGVSWKEEGEVDPTAAAPPDQSVELLRDRIVKLEHEVATLRRRLNLLLD